MQIKEKMIEVKDYITKSNLPVSDFVINPYVGCPHACKYCYACFMKRFSGHHEEWGAFLDVKQCAKPLSRKKLAGRRVFLSSVTDCYNPYEEKYCVTQKIVQQLSEMDCFVTITTKSALILRDLALLKKFRKLTVALSINTLDEEFRQDMDRASSVAERLHTLQTLHENGIDTVLFMSPIFPKITDFRSIIQCSSSFVNTYWFENLNLRGAYKEKILRYIREKYPQYITLYEQIYYGKDTSFWDGLADEIAQYCSENNVQYENFFHHEKLVAQKNS